VCPLPHVRASAWQPPFFISLPPTLLRSYGVTRNKKVGLANPKACQAEVQYKNGFFTSLSALFTVCLLHRGCARFRTFVLQRGSLPFLFRFRQRSFGAMA